RGRKFHPADSRRKDQIATLHRCALLRSANSRPIERPACSMHARTRDEFEVHLQVSWRRDRARLLRKSASCVLDVLPVAVPRTTLQWFCFSSRTRVLAIPVSLCGCIVSALPCLEAELFVFVAPLFVAPNESPRVADGVFAF